MDQKWFVKGHTGDFLLHDALWSGRPVEVDSDQIETLIENSQCYTMQEIAKILKVSKSIQLLMKMKNVSFITFAFLLCFIDYAVTVVPILPLFPPPPSMYHSLRQTPHHCSCP